jgi:hypothetical protein
MVVAERWAQQATTTNFFFVQRVRFLLVDNTFNILLSNVNKQKSVFVISSFIVSGIWHAMV